MKKNAVLLTTKRARDLVSESEMWHLVRSVAEKSSPSNTRLSMLPAECYDDKQCAPLNDSQLLKRAVADTKAFRSAMHLPCYMSLVEVGALRILGSAFAHKLGEGRVKDATKAASSAFAKLYAQPLTKEMKVAFNALLKRSSAAADYDDHFYSLATLFRHTYTNDEQSAKIWPAEASQYAEQWKKAFRTSDADAQAWSAYLYTMAACGVLERDPQFVQRLAKRVGGTGSGNHKAVDALVQSIQNNSSTRSVQEIQNVSQATLLQATNVHKTKREVDLFA